MRKTRRPAAASAARTAQLLAALEACAAPSGDGIRSGDKYQALSSPAIHELAQGKLDPVIARRGIRRVMQGVAPPRTIRNDR